MKIKKIYDIKRIKKENKNITRKFKFKKFIYNSFIKEEKKNNITIEFSTTIFLVKRFLSALFYLCLIYLISYFIDKLSILLNIKFFLLNYVKYNKEIYTNFLISCVSIAGFLIALFYANLSSVFSSKYVFLSSRISKELINEKTNKKYINAIGNYMIIIIIILLLNIIGFPNDIIVAVITILMTLRIIIIFIELSKRIFIYSNTTFIAKNIMLKIIEEFKSVTSDYYCFDDKSFQNYHNNNVCEYIKIIRDLSNSLVESKDFEGLNSILLINISLISQYCEIKNKIPYDSLWYSTNPKGRSWFIENDIEIATAINTGTSLAPKLIRDRDFLEEILLNINEQILKCLIKHEKFEYVYEYFNYYNNCFESFSKSGEIEYWSNTTSSVINLIIKEIDFKKYQNNNSVTGLADLFSLLHINILLSFSNYYKFSFNLLESIKWDKITYKRALLLNNIIINQEDFLNFVKKIENEKYVEGKLITPYEFILEYSYLKLCKFYNLFQETIINDFKNLYELSDKLLKTKNYKASALTISRLIELNNKIEYHISSLEPLNNKIRSFNKRNYEFKLCNSDELFKKIKKIYIDSLKKYSEVTTMLYFNKYNIEKEQVDFIGEFYYNLTFLMIDFIINNDYDSFEKLYDDFIVICSISDEYIKNLIKPENFNAQFVINKYTMTTINLMNVSGFAIYYSHLINEKRWEDLILKKTKEIINKQKEENNDLFVSQCKKCARIINDSIAGITILSSNIKLKMENFVRNSGKLKYKYVGPFGFEEIENKDKLLKSFSFDKTIGFCGELYEVYLVYCINKLVKEDVYVSKYKWERRDK